MAHTTSWLTPATYARLRRELEFLSVPHADPEVDEEVDEEFGPRPADDVRATRVARIQALLKNAVVGETPPDDGVAEPGMVLTVDYGDGAEPETFLLGARDRAVEEKTAIYSPESPLGAALLGARQGEQRSYQAPNGKTFIVTLLDARPYNPNTDT